MICSPPSPTPEQAAEQVGEALRRSSEARRQAWARSYLNAFLQRDVPEIAEGDKLLALPQLLAALAQVCGQLCNDTQLGARIGLDGKKVSRFLRILEQLFLVRRVPAWGRVLSIQGCGSGCRIHVGWLRWRAHRWISPPGSGS